MPHSDSPESSVESSPNAPRRFLPSHLLQTLSPSKQVIPEVLDSESDDQSVPLPLSYYVSPSRPEKRIHLTIPSPKMAQLSIQGPTRRFKPSILGYGEGMRKIVWVSSSRPNSSGSTSRVLSQRGLGDHIFGEGIQSVIPVSDLGLLRHRHTAGPRSLASSSRHVSGRCVQRLFPHLAYDLENEEGGKEMHAKNPESASPSGSPIAKVPIRRRILLAKMRNITM